MFFYYCYYLNNDIFNKPTDERPNCLNSMYALKLNSLLIIIVYSITKEMQMYRKEGNVLFNDVLNTFLMVIWHWTYSKGLFR